MKLYFCAHCGVLAGKENPEDTEGLECQNCGIAFDDSRAIEGTFDDKDGDSLLIAGTEPAFEDEEEEEEE